ncbi:MAG: hypothetical protein C0514_06075 [Candidatus Puniceispirillum sp.]|nr:hypothetical protein [Candidatus Puniceispirillum sp.]
MGNKRWEILVVFGPQNVHFFTRKSQPHINACTQHRVLGITQMQGLQKVRRSPAGLSGTRAHGLTPASNARKNGFCARASLTRAHQRPLVTHTPVNVLPIHHILKAQVAQLHIGDGQKPGVF